MSLLITGKLFSGNVEHFPQKMKSVEHFPQKMFLNITLNVLYAPRLQYAGAERLRVGESQPPAADRLGTVDAA